MNVAIGSTWRSKFARMKVKVLYSDGNGVLHRSGKHAETYNPTYQFLSYFSPDPETTMIGFIRQILADGVFPRGVSLTPEKYAIAKRVVRRLHSVPYSERSKFAIAAAQTWRDARDIERPMNVIMCTKDLYVGQKSQMEYYFGSFDRHAVLLRVLTGDASIVLDEIGEH